MQTNTRKATNSKGKPIFVHRIAVPHLKNTASAAHFSIFFSIKLKRKKPNSFPKDVICVLDLASVYESKLKKKIKQDPSLRKWNKITTQATEQNLITTISEKQ